MPFGLSGIVVGIFNGLFEVVFDEPFMGGSNLMGRCSYFRGAIVEFLDVFNIEDWFNYLAPRNISN